MDKKIKKKKKIWSMIRRRIIKKCQSMSYHQRSFLFFLMKKNEKQATKKFMGQLLRPGIVYGFGLLW